MDLRTRIKGEPLYPNSPFRKPVEHPEHSLHCPFCGEWKHNGTAFSDFIWLYVTDDNYQDLNLEYGLDLIKPSEVEFTSSYTWVVERKPEYYHHAFKNGVIYTRGCDRCCTTFFYTVETNPQYNERGELIGHSPKFHSFPRVDDAINWLKVTDVPF